MTLTGDGGEKVGDLGDLPPSILEKTRQTVKSGSNVNSFAVDRR
jgi:hypothetical protein